MSEDIPDLGDIGIPSAAGAGALAIYMLVGPSLRAVGNAFGDWTDYRVRNLLRIGEKAGQRLEGKPDVAFRAVHPRLAHELIENASWVDNELQQDYHAALLAAASQSPKSEEIAYYSRILSNMSPAQTALHYATYRAYAGTTQPVPVSKQTFNRLRDTKDVAIHAKIGEFNRVTGGTLSWATAGLQHEGLMAEVGWSDRDDQIYCVTPTAAGALLYWLTFDYPDPIDSIRWSDDEVRLQVPAWRGADVPAASTLRQAFVAPARQVARDDGDSAES